MYVHSLTSISLYMEHSAVAHAHSADLFSSMSKAFLIPIPLSPHNYYSKCSQPLIVLCHTGTVRTARAYFRVQRKKGKERGIGCAIVCYNM